MKLVYSRRALADLSEIATYYVLNASPKIAESIEHRLSDVIDRIGRAPEATPRISQRSGVRVAAVVRYPFQIFYRVRVDAIDILHISTYVWTSLQKRRLALVFETVLLFWIARRRLGLRVLAFEKRG